MAGSFTPAGIIAEVQGFARYIQDLNRMDSANQGLNKGLGGVVSGYTGLGKKILSVSGSLVGVGVSAVVGMTKAIAAFGVSVVEEGRAYTKEMSNVAALTQATEKEFAALSATAEELGRTTKFTATEAAEGMSFLAMAGFEVNEIIGAMPGVLNLASASNLELGRAADIVSNVLSGFGASTDETTRFVDVLAKTAASSNTSVDQLGQAFKFVAPVAAAFGFTVEETAAALGTLGDAGLQAGIAGRGLRGLLSKLGAPTKDAKAAMEELGIQIFDTNGEMNSLSNIIGQFNAATADMTDQQRAAALSTIFSREEITSMLVLMEKGEGDLASFGAELENSVGFAAEVAAKQLDNLSGDITLFQSALSGVKIDIFKALEPLLRKVVQAGTSLIATFGGPLTNVINNQVLPAIISMIDFVQRLFDAFGTSRAQSVNLLTKLGLQPDLINQALSFIDNLIVSINKIQNAYENFGARGATVSILGRLGFTPDQIAEVLSFFDKIRTAIDQAITTILSMLGTVSTGASNFDWVSVVAGTVTVLNDNFDALQGAIVGIGAALAGAAIAAAVVGITAAIIGMLNPVTLIVAAAAALGAAWSTNFLGIRDITAQVWSFIEPVFTMLQTWLSTNLTIAMQAVSDVFTQNWPMIQAAIQTFWVIAGAVFNSFMSVMQSQLMPTITDVINTLTETINKLGIDWGDVFNALGQATMIVGAIIGAAILAIIAVVAGLAVAVATAVEHIIIILDGLLQGGIRMFAGLRLIIEGFMAFFSGDFHDGIDMITLGVIELIGGMKDSVLSLFTGLIVGVGEILASFVETVFGFFSDLYFQLVGGSIVPDLINEIIGWFESLVGPVVEVISGLVDSVAGLFKNIFSFFGGEQLELDFSEILNNFTEILPEAVGQFRTFVLETFNGFTELAKLYAEFLTITLAQQAMSTLTRETQRMASNTTQQFENIISVVNELNDMLVTIAFTSMPAITGAITTLKSQVDTDMPTIIMAFNNLKTALGDLDTTIRQTVNPAIASIKTTVDSALTGAGGATATVNDFTTVLGNVTSKINDDIIPALNSIKTKSEEAFNKAKDKADEFKDKLQEIIDKAKEAKEAIEAIPGPSSGGGSAPKSSNDLAKAPITTSSLSNQSSVVNQFFITTGPINNGMDRATVEQLIIRTVQKAI